MECDLHGFTLYDAIEEIIYTLELCIALGEKSLCIIHGYQHGKILRNYFRSKAFLEDMKHEGYNLEEANHPNPGISIFKII